MIINKSTDNKKFPWLWIYSETFPPQDKLGWEILPNSNRPYLSNPLVILTSFIGLPNNQRLNRPLTISDVFKNMIDWSPIDKKIIFNILDTLFAPFMFIYHFIRMLYKTIFSIVKLFTEFLPGITEEFCRITMENAKNNNIFIYGITALGYGLFSAIHFVGRAITSPLKNSMATMHEHDFFLVIASIIISGIVWGSIIAFTLLATAGVSLPFIFPNLIANCITIVGASILFFESTNTLFSISHGFIKSSLKIIINACTGNSLQKKPSENNKNDNPNSYNTTIIPVISNTSVHKSTTPQIQPLANTTDIPIAPENAKCHPEYSEGSRYYREDPSLRSG